MGPLAWGEHVYPYERSSATKWRTKYVDKQPVWRLPREARLALLKAVARMFAAFFEALGRLAAAHHKARLLVQEHKEVLEALGLPEDEG